MPATRTGRSSRRTVSDTIRNASLRKVYTFVIQLLGSQNPVIKRVVEVPSWFDFEEFHFVIQYAFGWELKSEHGFYYVNEVDERDNGTYDIYKEDVAMLIKPKNQEMDVLLGTGRKPRGLVETNIRLYHVYDGEGRYYSRANHEDGTALPLIYIYDSGAEWQHSIFFAGESEGVFMDQPIILQAIGDAPPDGCDGIDAWEEFKATQGDAGANRPGPSFNNVDVNVLNEPSRWHNSLCSYRREATTSTYHLGKAYRLKIEILGCKEPSVTRTIDIPASYTFHNLHLTIQYAFGWENRHLHLFSFTTATPDPHTGDISVRPENTALEILADDDDIIEPMNGQPAPPTFYESKIKLSDVYDPNGRYHHLVKDEEEGPILPMRYLYDPGDDWEHWITFEGELEIPVYMKYPTLTEASGCTPSEDCGGPYVWNGAKPPPNHPSHRIDIAALNQPRNFLARIQEYRARWESDDY